MAKAALKTKTTKRTAKTVFAPTLVPPVLLATDEQLEKAWQMENRNRTPIRFPELVRALGLHSPRYAGSMYLSNFTRTKLLRERIALAIQALKPWTHLFDAIAFSGMSGAIIAPPVAVSLDKELIMVRKSDSNGHRSSHSDHWIEGDIGARAYVILDDFIDSGRTRDYIKKRIRHANPESEFLGLLQVNHLDAGTLADFERRRVPYPLAQ